MGTFAITDMRFFRTYESALSYHILFFCSCGTPIARLWFERSHRLDCFLRACVVYTVRLWAKDASLVCGLHGVLELHHLFQPSAFLGKAMWTGSALLAWCVRPYCVYSAVQQYPMSPRIYCSFSIQRRRPWELSSPGNAVSHCQAMQITADGGVPTAHRRHRAC